MHIAVILFPSLALASASTFSQRSGGKGHDFASIKPASHLHWSPCYEGSNPNLTCARLEVPLDYDDHSRGNTDIAFIKYTASTEKEAPSLLINPGGPGNSGTQVVKASGKALAKLSGGTYNVVGFDPRGVGDSGPVIDCWPGHPEKRAQFQRLFYPEISNASSTALNKQYYIAEIFGDACSASVGGSKGNASYITTPLVARDMLSFIEAEQAVSEKPAEKAKLSYYGVSYGTILGATFASMFPDRIDKMVLDGVLEASDYYDLHWQTNLQDTDKVLESFFSSCHQVGAQNCTFWGPSVHNITARFDKIVIDMKSHPIPIPNPSSCGVPLMATYSDLKQLIFQAMYSPLEQFAKLADVLSGLERGNTTAYEVAVTGGSIAASPCANETAGLIPDAPLSIICADGDVGQRFQDVSQFRKYVDELTVQSRFFGEVWASNLNTVSCRSFDVKPPKSGRLSSNIMDPKKTSFPLLLVTSSLDPVTPKSGAHRMSTVFPGSVVLTQNSTGHSAVGSASSCVLENIQTYLSGRLPAQNATCQPDLLPFQGQSSPINFRG
ncbi:hypothetical protein N7492_003920 [Penicillium capsulatum]|uniref:AB hydrolase-1 domain-containing protein n=1 Tax=Penicillium capsulatum TaxID=69766 RepID=A0A9W9ILF8_9EURO|nr:hypothetical protein N7492_003920 [Penicillium capsulatum]KAJ6121500.1 hypothetical protein N7512_003965 [Penicillium capsulatum]